MNKIAKFAILSSALIFSQVAHAAPPSGTLSGVVVVHKGVTLVCDITIDIVNVGGVDKAYISLTPGDPGCAILNFNNAPYTMTTSGTAPNETVTFHNVDVTTITAGDCAGDIGGNWDGTELTIDSYLPAKTAGADCTVVGFAG